ncbi:histidine phosphatase family protein [Deinococcus arcticus]|uniref:Histidine phosphatase family protein n=1 Tax=Deinococcus arcticus TaxID=2136176 RepID=A0A2T3W5Z9_9DEIO|nr:histidine phosphatase family protein [Deinococcus arcticus]PTA67183.1 histidine phosphatase family protein [Deinococcus arcticus]
MAELLLVRHAQATPFDPDSDRLSPLGQVQARRTGRMLAAEGMSPTQVWHGPLNRQRRTAELAAQAAGDGWPFLTEDPRLAEYDGEGLMRVLAPQLAAQVPRVAAQLGSLGRPESEPAERQRAFQGVLETVAQHWQAGTLTHPTVEPWPAFQSRVAAALHDLVKLPSGTRAVVFTSGGVIALLVAQVLSAPPASMLALDWRVRNASVTRLSFGRGRVSLDSFNEVHHLPPQARSWR